MTGRTLGPGLLLLASLILTGGCAADEPAGAGDQASATPSSDSSSVSGTVIAIEVADGAVTPSGERVEAEVGEPITFQITADEPGTLHVHSTEGPEIDFEAGTSQHQVVVNQPGIVEVELHDPALIVVQLEVS